MIECPPTTTIKAIDVKPHYWAQWCTIEGYPEPFANTIVSVKWSEDGQHLWFMLDTHNFLKASPDEELELIPQDVTQRPVSTLQRIDRDHLELLTNRPTKPDVRKALLEAKKAIDLALGEL
jgi:hypothetical protein